jgi:hypothetical protein
MGPRCQELSIVVARYDHGSIILLSVILQIPLQMHAYFIFLSMQPFNLLLIKETVYVRRDKHTQHHNLSTLYKNIQ